MGIGVVAALALSSAMPASAATLDVSLFSKAEGWDVFRGDSACGAMIEFEGKGATDLTLILNLDGRFSLQLTNTAWTSSEGASYVVSWLFAGHVYTGNVRGIELSSSGRHGFIGFFDQGVAAKLAAAERLVVLKGNVTVDSVSLKGSGAAIAAVRRCLALVRSRHVAAERELHRFDHIADDPFRAASPPPVSIQDSGGLDRYFSAADYPDSARRAREQGKVAVRVTIDWDGRPKACTVIGSSGSPDLDAATCRIIERRARFPAATSGSDTVNSSVNWVLPHD